MLQFVNEQEPVPHSFTFIHCPVHLRLQGKARVYELWGAYPDAISCAHLWVAVCGTCSFLGTKKGILSLHVHETLV